MGIDRLRDALEALGPPVTPLELAEMLWLAERLPSGEDEGDLSDAQGARSAMTPEEALDRAGFSGGRQGGVPWTRGGQETGHADQDGPPDTGGVTGAQAAPEAPHHRAALHVPRDTPCPGTD